MLYRVIRSFGNNNLECYFLSFYFFFVTNCLAKTINTIISMNIIAANKRTSLACDSKNDNLTITNMNKLPNATVDSHIACTTDFIRSGACSYENA